MIFDIGAYKGNFSQYVYNKIINLNKDAKIDFHLFDPILKTKKFIQKLNFKNIFYNNIAIHNFDGKSKFFLNNFFEPSGSSIQSINKNDKLWKISRKIFLQIISFKFNVGDFEKITVDCKTLDSYIFENKINNIDILKIDTEGNEFNVLIGSIETLKSKKIKIIYLEIMELKNIFNKKKNKIIEFLDKYNFSLVEEKNLFLSSTLSNIKVQDLIFYNNDLK